MNSFDEIARENSRKDIDQRGVDIAESEMLGELYSTLHLRIRDEGILNRNTILDELDELWRVETIQYPYLVPAFERMVKGSEQIAWNKWRRIKGESNAETNKRLAENRPYEYKDMGQHD